MTVFVAVSFQGCKGTKKRVIISKIIQNIPKGSLLTYNQLMCAVILMLMYIKKVNRLVVHFIETNMLFLF